MFIFVMNSVNLETSRGNIWAACRH